jgi:hexulose-6-phosphate isomerase
MKKSIGDNMFRKEWGFDKGLALVKKAGYDGIELWLGATPWFQLETADAQVRELRGKIDDAGLLVSNVSNSLDWDRPLSSRDPRVREQAVRHITRQIETAQILGTDAILVVAGLVTEETPIRRSTRARWRACRGSRKRRPGPGSRSAARTVAPSSAS